MTAESKAKELVEKYKPFVYPYIGSSFMTGDEYPEAILNNAKNGATILVDEIISAIKDINYEYDCTDYVEGWEQVKEEINKL